MSGSCLVHPLLLMSSRPDTKPANGPLGCKAAVTLCCSMLLCGPLSALIQCTKYSDPAQQQQQLAEAALSCLPVCRMFKATCLTSIKSSWEDVDPNPHPDDLDLGTPQTACTGTGTRQTLQLQLQLARANLAASPVPDADLEQDDGQDHAFPGQLFLNSDVAHVAHRPCETPQQCVVQLREAGQVEVDTAEMRRVRARLAARAEAEEELMARCLLSL